MQIAPLGFSLLALLASLVGAYSAADAATLGESNERQFWAPAFFAAPTRHAHCDVPDQGYELFRTSEIAGAADPEPAATPGEEARPYNERAAAAAAHARARGKEHNNRGELRIAHASERPNLVTELVLAGLAETRFDNTLRTRSQRRSISERADPNFTFRVVPLPSTLPLLMAALAFAGLVVLRRRRVLFPL